MRIRKSLKTIRIEKREIYQFFKINNKNTTRTRRHFYSSSNELVNVIELYRIIAIRKCIIPKNDTFSITKDREIYNISDVKKSTIYTRRHLHSPSNGIMPFPLHPKEMQGTHETSAPFEAN